MSIQAIENRRSIRRYKSDALPNEVINQVLRAASLAPSGKNRQPWRFVVVGGLEKDTLLQVFQRGIERERDGNALLPDIREGLSDAQNTLNIMRQSPVVILVLNNDGGYPFQESGNEEKVAEMVNLLSIGAAIENMLLEAVDLGLGTLWIGNTFFAYPEICGWLETDRQLVAAIAIGYPDEKPASRPRYPLQDIVEYRL